MKKIITLLLIATLVLLIAVPMDSNAKTTKSKFAMDKSKEYTYVGKYQVGSPITKKTKPYTLVSSKNDSLMWVPKNKPNSIGWSERLPERGLGYSTWNCECSNGYEYTLPPKPKKGFKMRASIPGETKKELIYTILSTNATVKTKARTFKNVLIIKHPRVKIKIKGKWHRTGGDKVYFAPHNGIVKAVNYKNQTTFEVVKIKKVKKSK